MDGDAMLSEAVPSSGQPLECLDLLSLGAEVPAVEGTWTELCIWMQAVKCDTVDTSCAPVEVLGKVI